MPAGAGKRELRQQAILRILRRRQVSRQDELVALLRREGIEATQSSISRDLRQLGISKLDQEYQPVDAGTDPTALQTIELVAEFVRDIRTAGPHLTVVRTSEGAAAQVALQLDRAGWREIVGTVSGDDTVFIATASVGDQRRLLVRLRAHFA